MRPAIAKAIPLMAPSTSPRVMAFEVPTAWLEVPIATPATTGSRTRKSYSMAGAHTAPKMPVKTTAATVTAGIPPMLGEMANANGVETDFTKRESVKTRSRPNHLLKKYADPTETKEPTTVPARTGRKYFLRRAS